MRSHPLGSTMWLVETILLAVSRNRTSNLFVTGRGREILVEETIRDTESRFGSLLELCPMDFVEFLSVPN